MKTKKQKTQSQSKQQGQALVETALIIPIVFVLLLGVLEFGQMLMIHQSLTNAAREGARVGALSLDSTVALTNAQTIAENYLQSTGVDETVTTITPAFVDVNGTQGIQVNINHDYTSILTAWLPGLNDTLQLRSVSVMRRES